MNKSRVLLTVLFLLPAAAGRTFDLNSFKGVDLEKAATGATKVAKGLFKMSDKDEAALGHETSSYLCAHYGLVKDEALTRYVSSVGQLVARRSERTDIAYRFGVLNTDEVNAYAAPGGYVFITKGMIKLIKDESELAGALAHEVGHIARRHAAKALQKSNLIEGGVELASAKENAPEALRAANDYTVGLLFKGYDRNDERDADRAALQYAAKAGYDAGGLPRLLSRLAESHPDENRFKALGKSHPPAKDRLALLQKEGPAPSSGATNAPRFTQATASLP